MFLCEINKATDIQHLQNTKLSFFSTNFHKFTQWFSILKKLYTTSIM